MAEIARKVGRPKGSLNKPKFSKNTSKTYVVALEKQIEGSAITRKNALGWVNWGLKNNV